MKYWTNCFFAICIIVILTSCTTSSIQSTLPSPIFTVTSQPVTSPNSLPAVTATATRAETITPTLARSFTPEPMKTLTQSEREQAQAEIMQLFQSSDNCRPPCFLGVIPEQTTTTELREIFAKWGIELKVSTQNISSFYIDQSFQGGYELNAEFLMKDDVVESIGFRADQDEPSEWAGFSAAGLLERYGTPSNVSFWIGSIHEPSSTPWKGWYYMSMSYDELDLYISYGDVEIRLDQNAVVCPQTDEYGSGQVWLGKYPNFLPPPHETYIEDAASMTVQKFHDYVLTGPGACFYLDLNKVVFL